ncbi:hypothetical protein HPB51_026220 [Rhipicephalus microplus]|uniref:Uncharacterized protein n=1 Tax=Rhipicephalus microplus TaxID=6941 RepID=A0A9J6DXI5_RHIMP|nr:hypothetical protein HPB51_026220 [Rhipicephalus microplus]
MAVVRAALAPPPPPRREGNQDRTRIQGGGIARGDGRIGLIEEYTPIVALPLAAKEAALLQQDASRLVCCRTAPSALALPATPTAAAVAASPKPAASRWRPPTLSPLPLFNEKEQPGARTTSAVLARDAADTSARNAVRCCRHGGIIAARSRAPMTRDDSGELSSSTCCGCYVDYINLLSLRLLM